MKTITLYDGPAVILRFSTPLSITRAIRCAYDIAARRGAIATHHEIIVA